MKVVSKTLPVFFVILLNTLFAGAVFSQTTNVECSDVSKAADATICDDKKKAAIEELLKVTEFDERVKLLSKALESNAKKAFKLAVADELKLDGKYKELSKDEFEKNVEEQSQELVKKYMVLFKEQIDLRVVVKKIAFDTYAKYFSSEEIKDIVAFYKTPTGAKARKVMPRLARESLIETQEFMRPKLRSILKTVLDGRKAEPQEPVKKKADV